MRETAVRNWPTISSDTETSTIAELAKWDSFCIILGSAAGALVGLQFVVLTLVTLRGNPE